MASLRRSGAFGGGGGGGGGGRRVRAFVLGREQRGISRSQTIIAGDTTEN